jgi:hypothetical protein
MKDTVLIAYSIWPILALLLFLRYPPGRALTLTYVVGWLVLPNAWSGTADPIDLRSLSGVALLSACFLTKASVIGVSAAIPSLLLARPLLLRLRPSILDLPVVAWVLSPLLSSLANHRPISAVLTGVAYHAAAWGIPWILGRAYLADFSRLTAHARLIRNATVLLLPLAVVELFVGPVWHRVLYGTHPHMTDGAIRYFGFRPLIFFEDGNQAGLWMGLAAVIAIWLWRTDPRSVPRSRSWFMPALLTLATIAFQSLGAILLMLLGFAILPIGRLRYGRLALLLVTGLTVFYVSIRATDLVPLRKLSQDTAIGRETEKLLKTWGRGSLGWRLNLEEVHLRRAWEKPIRGIVKCCVWRRDRKAAYPLG